MGRRRTKKQFNLVLLFYISIVIIYLMTKLINWSVSLNPAVWVIILLGISLLMVAKRHFTLQKKKIEFEQRKHELERIGSLQNLKELKPIDFEYYICDLFTQMGFDAHVTKASGDGGKDILVYKKDFHAIIECKRYTKQKVTRPDIQKFHSAMIDCKAEKGFFITTSEFTAQASSYCLDKPIVLIDGVRLVRLIEEITKDEEETDFTDTILKMT